MRLQPVDDSSTRLRVACATDERQRQFRGPTGPAARVALHALLLCATSTACVRAPRWTTPLTGRVSLSAIVAALDDSGHDRPRETDTPLPELPPLRHFRPCCAFGENLAVAVGRLPVPGVWIANIRGPGDIGPHSYDA